MIRLIPLAVTEFGALNGQVTAFFERVDPGASKDMDMGKLLASLYIQVPPLNSPRLKHELLKHVKTAIMELNDIPRARAPGGEVHKHSNFRALTRHRGTRYRRQRN
jgi:hypothetical protein